MSLRTCIVVAAEGVALDEDSDVEGAAAFEVTEDENVEPVEDTETAVAVEVEGCGDGEEPKVKIIFNKLAQLIHPVSYLPIKSLHCQIFL